MSLFFIAGTKAWKKVVGSIFMALLLGALFSLLLHDFVAATYVLKLALYVSVGLTATSLLIPIFLLQNSFLKPWPIFYGYSTTKKVVLTSLLPLLVFGLFWINSAIFLPRLFTSFFGTVNIKNDVARKVERRSRKSCDYRLDVKSIESGFFHHCISEGHFNNLPDDEIRVKLKIKQSVVGYIVENVEPIGEKG